MAAARDGDRLPPADAALSQETMPDSDPPLSTATDADLFFALQAGQPDALGVLYDRYGSLVYGLAIRILANVEESEDVTQEVFLALNRKQYDPARGSLGNFLVVMTRSRSLDRLRSRTSRNRFLQRWQGMVKSESTASLLEQASVSERSQRVREALAQLPEKERQVLEIAYYEGLSQSEIAKRLNAPLGTIKTHCRQGLLKLRQMLQDVLTS